MSSSNKSHQCKSDSPSNFRYNVPTNLKHSDLNLMDIEITVLDRKRLGQNKILGKLKIGQKDEHWLQMLEQDGTMVQMMHTLKDI